MLFWRWRGLAEERVLLCRSPPRPSPQVEQTQTNGHKCHAERHANYDHHYVKRNTSSSKDDNLFIIRLGRLLMPSTNSKVKDLLMVLHAQTVDSLLQVQLRLRRILPLVSIHGHDPVQDPPISLVHQINHVTGWPPIAQLRLSRDMAE
eukprot:CAMPEP_0178377494 /NCGR_PEP_ID=MMETSP0689_2-20121128/3947_1 /TAXON_ID=160604 /ORGANISM="Amphidinium massartii, Strain CS-259" /LENGTH=147 /DNA_ID=CAMNT_0019997549 /DNA_START=147 /DNA_END=590 /DNA_ORIENTATION=-